MISQWFTSYLSGRTQAIVADGFLSNSLYKGVPQRSIFSILDPLLFTVFINNIVPFSLPCNIHFYADDIILYSNGPTLNVSKTDLQSFSSTSLTIGL